MTIPDHKELPSVVSDSLEYLLSIPKGKHRWETETVSY
jgi:hypothetical protein